MAKPAVVAGGGGAGAAPGAVAAVPAASEEAALAADQAEPTYISPASADVVAEPAVPVGGRGAAAVAVAAAVVPAVPAPNKQAAVSTAAVGSVAVVTGAGKAAVARDPYEGRKGAARAGRVESVVVPPRRLPTARGIIGGVAPVLRRVAPVLRRTCIDALIAVAVVAFTVAIFRLTEGVNDKPCARGHALSPGDGPLQPGQCIEGRMGFRRLGWIPGLSWTPRLEVRSGGEMVVTRPDGSEVLLAGAVSEDKGSTSFLCKAERLVRGVVRMGTPVYGARSRLGQLVLGQERFCGVDASVVTLSSRSLAKVWRKGGGILGFTEEGDLEMVTRSGDVIWSHAARHGFDEIEVRRKMNNKVIKMLEKKHAEERRKRLARIEKDLDQTVKRRQKESEKEGASEDTEKDGAKKKKTRRRKRVFGSNNDAAGEAATDGTSTTTEGRPHAENAFVRVFSWGRSSPKGAGGQSG